MNKTLTLLLVLCLPALTACKGGKNNKAADDNLDSLRFEVVRDSVVKDSGNYKYVFDVPSDADDKNVEAVRGMMIKYMNVKAAAGQDLRAYMAAACDSSIAEHSDYNNPANPNIHHVTATLEANNKQYATYLLRNEIYLSGAAHGNYSEYHCTIDLKTGRVLGWEDIFNPGAKEQLPALLRKALTTQYYKGEKPGFETNTNVWPFSLPEPAPGLTAEGIVFHWAPYEIDCFAAGAPTCTLSYEEVKDLLKAAVWEP